ncbi:GH25 family lysozyme [Streptomyces sp. NPDC047002]|uniref:GH25 family lysozyme n=1 Tax=Streptomyces sp. NPDC047002 TaxID=3155475 RepID=UPI003453060A
MDPARMFRRRSVRRALCCAAATFAGLTGPAVALPGTAAAAPAPAAPTAQAAQNPELDWMGSTVRAHEGSAARPPAAPAPRATQTPGMDVSHYQGTVNWASAYGNGARFAYMKATEGTTYRDPNFSANYTGSYNTGFIRGAYHFATPNTSTGAAQADYFVAHGGGWSKDGKTLPPMLDIEYGSSSTCWGLSQASMVSWITSFVNEVHAKTTRWPTIYTTTDWWTTCTGNTAAFSADDPLFVARYSSSVGTLPAGWPFYTFWQFADSGTFPGDQDRFNGPLSGVVNLANNV